MTPLPALASPLLTTAAAATNAGSSGPGNAVGWGWLILASLTATAVYLASCALWPFARCRWCRGSGRARSPSGRAWRECRRCRGTGSRLRPGRKAWTHTKTTYRRGTRPGHRLRHRGDPWQ